MSALERNAPDRYEVLQRPLRIGGIEVANRLALTATGLGLYGNDPEAYADNIQGFVEARAKGGVGLMIIAAFGIGRLDALPPQEDDGDFYERFVPVMATFSAAAREHGVPVGLQLLHRGAQSPPNAPTYGPSTTGWSPRLPAPVALTDEDTWHIVHRTARCAALAVEAGFDFVEIHAGHGYLLNEFMSPRFNDRREGEFVGREGGELLVEATISAVRGAVAVPISLRISAEERTTPGLGLEEMAAFAAKVAPSVDLLNVSGGAYGSRPVIVAPSSVGYGFNAPLAAAIKPLVDTPVLVAGRIWDPELMAHLVESGACDMIGLARALWADPELPRKVFAGRVNEVRPAIGCNQGCIDRIGGVRRTCLVNPFWGREREMRIEPTVTSRRVVVVGAGPAGLEVAGLAAERGHDVVLVEAGTEVGGRFLLASKVPGKAEYTKYLEWQLRRVLTAGVDLRLGHRFEPDDVAALRADVLVMAPGGRVVRRVDRARVLSPDEAIRRPWLVPGPALVAGGDRQHLEAALLLAELGHRVRVVAGANLAPGMGPTARYHLLEYLRDLGVVAERSPEPDDVAVGWESSDGETLIAGRTEPASRHQIVAPGRPDVEVHWIGDAVEPRDALAAVAEAAELALAL